MTTKMYCIFAKESILKMGGNRGKLAAQAGHAYLHAFWDATTTVSNVAEGKHTGLRPKYEQAVAYAVSGKAYKIALVVETISELEAIQERYKDICGTSLVKDAANTVFTEPTVTCLGLGPIHEDNIGEDLKALKVLI